MKLPFNISFQNFSLSKLLLLVGFIAVSIGMGFLVYYLFFRSPEPEIIEPTITPGQLPVAQPGVPPTVVEPGQPTLPTAEGEPTLIVPGAEVPVTASPVAQGGITTVNSISSETNFAAKLAVDGSNIISYNASDGLFYRTTPSGQRITLSDKQFFDVQDINWANQSTKVILEYPDGSNIYYDFETDTQITLPQTWTEFDFSPQDNKIVFKEDSTDPQRKWLSVANPDGSGKIKLEPLGNNGHNVDVDISPTNQVVALYKEAGGTNKATVYLIGQNGENFKGLPVKGLGFESKWSPDGEKLVYSVYNEESDYKPVLWITDAYGESIGSNNQSLQINTWSNKCTFHETDTLYCGVPTSLETGAGLQPNTADLTPDNIYRIDLNTGARSLVAIPDISLTVDSMSVSDDGTYLYVTDKLTQSLSTIRLK